MDVICHTSRRSPGGFHQAVIRSMCLRVIQLSLGAEWFGSAEDLPCSLVPYPACSGGGAAAVLHLGPVSIDNNIPLGESCHPACKGEGLFFFGLVRLVADPGEGCLPVR